MAGSAECRSRQLEEGFDLRVNRTSHSIAIGIDLELLFVGQHPGQLRVAQSTFDGVEDIALINANSAGNLAVSRTHAVAGHAGDAFSRSRMTIEIGGAEGLANV